MDASLCDGHIKAQGQRARNGKEGVWANSLKEGVNASVLWKIGCHTAYTGRTPHMHTMDRICRVNATVGGECDFLVNAGGSREFGGGLG